MRHARVVGKKVSGGGREKAPDTESGGGNSDGQVVSGDGRGTELTHISLFTGIGGFDLAAEWAGFRTIAMCEIDPFCQEVLRKHWPDVPIFPDIKRLTGLQIFDTIRSNEKRIHGSGEDVSGGPFDSGSGGILRDHPSGNVGRPKMQGMQIPPEDSGRRIESFLSGDESEREGAESFGGSDREGDCSEKDALRELLGYGGVQGREDKDSGSPRGLREAPGSGVALPEMPSRMAHKEQGEGRVNVTLLTAGVPCQPASVAGKRRGKEDDRWLWGETFRIIHEVKPTWAILENVGGLLTLESGVVFEKLLSDLEGQGYEVQPVIIPACAVNAPHRRMRVWIVAHRDDLRHARELREAVSGREDEAITNPEPGGGDSGGDSLFGQMPGDSAHAPQDPLLGGDRGRGGGAISTQWDIPWIEVAQRFCVLDARLSDGLAGYLGITEAHVKVRDENRVKKLKALGNAIVPQVAYEIIKGIAEIERGMT